MPYFVVCSTPWAMGPYATEEVATEHKRRVEMADSCLRDDHHVVEAADTEAALASLLLESA